MNLRMVLLNTDSLPMTEIYETIIIEQFLKVHFFFKKRRKNGIRTSENILEV